MKNIAFVISSLHGGGAERVVANLVNAYNSNKIFLITGQPFEDDYTLINNVRRENLLTGNLIKDTLRLKKFFLKGNIETAIGFDLYVNWCLCLTNCNIKTKIIISERNAPKESMISRKSRLLIKLLYWRADSYVFQTNRAKEYYSRAIQERSTIIHNPVKTDLPYRMDRPSLMQISKKEVVAIGRLSPQKNFPMLLRAFSMVYSVHPEYCLRIYGRGKEEKKLQEMIEKNGLDEVVFLEGFKTDIHERIKYADIYVMSSDFEGMPNALMEAMAMGFPVICTDCPAGGPSELIRNNVNGIITPVGDEEKMAENIIKLIENPGLRNQLSREAVKIRETHSIDNIIAQWENIL